MDEKPVKRLHLLDLPPEIKNQIWRHAFGDMHLPLYTGVKLDRWHTYNEFLDCAACSDKTPREITYEARTIGKLWQAGPQATVSSLGRPYQSYNELVDVLLTCKTIYLEIANIFVSTLTLHLKSPEAIALFRRSAPKALRQGVNKIVLYIHFDRSNHFLWCMRLFELREAFPNLKHLGINYHMRPPVSYDNLSDAVYLSIPIIGFEDRFNKPAYVRTEDERATTSLGHINLEHKFVPSTDLKPGTTIHTSYMKSETLFEAHFLGSITTHDAIDEHTSVIRSVFTDPAYISAAQMVIRSNSAQLQHSVSQAYPPYQYPTDVLDRGFQNVTFLPGVQHTLLQIARRHEKPWFEKLQRRRIIEIYMQHCEMSKGDAERLLTRQLAALPEGQGIDDFMETLMMQGDDDENGLAGALGFGFGGQDFPPAWQQQEEE